MVFQVKLTRYAKTEIESIYLGLKAINPVYADQWFRDLMDKISTLQEKPKRCALARENDDFSQEIRQLIYGSSKNRYRVIFIVQDVAVYVLSVRHGARSSLTFNPLDLEES